MTKTSAADLGSASGPVLEARDLGRRYRRGWALQGCSFSLPAGTVVALVGPNGAGKSTLMSLATGIVRPTTGSVNVLGERVGFRGPHPRLALVSQDQPLYRRFTVEEMLHFGAAMNGSWDSGYARRLTNGCDVPLTARVQTLSGGQRTRVALALALSRRPAVVLLDEPLASLDPLARTEVLQTLMAEVVDTDITVVLSSHVIADIEDVCERLLLLTDGHLRLDGRIADLIAAHSLLTGPTADDQHWPPAESVVEIRRAAKQVTILVRDSGLLPPSGWTKNEPTLSELILAHLRADHSSRMNQAVQDEGGTVA